MQNPQGDLFYVHNTNDGSQFFKLGRDGWEMYRNEIKLATIHQQNMYGFAEKIDQAVTETAFTLAGGPAMDLVMAPLLNVGGKLLGGIFSKIATKGGSRALVQMNRIAGNAFRDQLANGLKAEGREVAPEVFKRTPFGPRYIDIEVSMRGRVLGGIETKIGRSRYLPLQRIKDIWLDLNTPGGYPIQLVRRP